MYISIYGHYMRYKEKSINYLILRARRKGTFSCLIWKKRKAFFKVLFGRSISTKSVHFFLACVNQLLYAVGRLCHRVKRLKRTAFLWRFSRPNMSQCKVRQKDIKKRSSKYWKYFILLHNYHDYILSMLA